ncbi:unnamed protein product, partial [Scytosiphon promiscuus]
VFFRLGLLSCFADSPARNALLDNKQTNGKTALPCHVCDVLQEELSDGKFDFERYRRTDDRTEYSLEVVGSATTKAEEQNIFMEHGVNVSDAPNPLRERVSMNMIRAIGIDVFHQDAQNSSRKVIKLFSRGLSPKNGEPEIACILKDPYLRLPGAPPFRDIVAAGGFTSQAGMDVWRLMSVLTLVVRPVLASVPSMKRLLTRQFLTELKKRLGVSSDDKALQELRALLRAATRATYEVRAGSFTEASVRAVEKSQRDK